MNKRIPAGFLLVVASQWPLTSLTYYDAFFRRTGTPTGSALMPHIDAFKHSLQEKMMEIGIRNGWKYDSYKKSFLIQEVRLVDWEERHEVGWWVFPQQALGCCLSLQTSSSAASRVRGTHSRSRSCDMHSRDGCVWRGAAAVLTQSWRRRTPGQLPPTTAESNRQRCTIDSASRKNLQRLLRCTKIGIHLRCFQEPSYHFCQCHEVSSKAVKHKVSYFCRSFSSSEYSKLLPVTRILQGCLSPSGLLSQNTINWVACQQQKCISHGSRR